jgi:hypothetical protein
MFKNINASFLPIREIKCKETYGDIDFLFPNIHSKESTIALLSQELEIYNVSITGHISNDNILSLALNNKHEIDIIFTDRVLLAHHYYSDNDRGNLLGNIFHHLGFNYGHKGLYLKLDNTKLLLSERTADILSFIGYTSPDIYKILELSFSFPTYEDMFDWVIKCPLFNSNYFQWESLNNKNRSRNKKRSSYNKFLEYIENKKFPNIEVSQNLIKFYALEFFGKEKEYLDIYKKLEFNKARKDLINGDIISKITGLTNNELGNFIVSYKNSESYKKIQDNNIDFFVNGNKGMIEQDIKEYYDTHFSKKQIE